jgi:phospholipase A1
MMIFETKRFITLFLLFSFSSLAIPASIPAAETEDRLAQCAGIEKDAERLKCFDELAKTKNTPQAAQPSDAAAPVAIQETPPEPLHQSVMSRQWDLDVHKKRIEDTFFRIRTYRPMYFLPVAYNSSPNEDTALDFDKNAKAQYNEAKFQLSFKMKPWGTDIEGIEVLRGIDIWLAYTQLAFWQVYNSAFFAPFRDTNYEPELLVNLRTDYHLLGLHGRILNLGFNHQSNGRSVPLSRSWNRLVANVGLENEKGDFNLLLKTWYRIPENENNDDNPDITRYMGYGELSTGKSNALLSCCAIISGRIIWERFNWIGVCLFPSSTISSAINAASIYNITTAMEKVCSITIKASTGLALDLCWRIGTGIFDC